MNKRILIIGQEPVSEKMGGVGIRQYMIAKTLSADFEVTMITPFPEPRESEGFELIYIPYTNIDLYKKHIYDSDIIYFNHAPYPLLTILEAAKKYIVVNLCPVYHFENLERMAAEGEISNSRFYSDINFFKRRIKLADFLLCGSERERDYYLGLLTAERKIPFSDYVNDKNFRNVIDILPNGISSIPPKKTGKIIRGVIKGVEDNDFLLIWSGAIWNWYDTDTLLKALVIAARQNPKIKLVFVSTSHPASKEATSRYQSLLKLASELNILGKNLFIMEGWIPYNERQNYLLEADAAIITSYDHIENHFSSRTRMFDYLWASLPVITTKGNMFSDLIETEGLGEVVGFEDVEGLAATIFTMVSNRNNLKKYSQRMKEIKNRFYWEKITLSLKKFCENPKKLKTDYESSLEEIPLKEMRSKRIKKILLIRSSPLPHVEQALIYLKHLFPAASIDVMLQSDAIDLLVDGTDGIKKIQYPLPSFQPDSAEQFFKRLLNEETAYDLAVCTLSSSDLKYYDNVIRFTKKSQARSCMAFTRRGGFADL